MRAMSRVLSIDAGTTGVTALVVDEWGAVVAKGYREFAQSFPQPGWVEHEPDDWWRALLAACAEALDAAGMRATDAAAIGLANQRETTVVWDRTNASRTMLFDIHRLAWDEELLEHLQIPTALLPTVKPSSTTFGLTDPDHFLGAAVPVAGMAGDQQSALFGQACFQPGMTKNTYGTGSFVLMNTGDRAVVSSAGLITTIACGAGDRVVYALEGSIFVTGAAIQWLRDGLGILDRASDAGPQAASVPDTDGVYFVPALTGLGAPWWDPYARGVVIGLTRGTTPAHIVRAAVAAMAYQTR